MHSFRSSDLLHNTRDAFVLKVLIQVKCPHSGRMRNLTHGDGPQSDLVLSSLHKHWPLSKPMPLL